MPRGWFLASRVGRPGFVAFGLMLCAVPGFAQYTATDLHPAAFGGSELLGGAGGVQVGDGSSVTSFHALLWRGTAASAVDLHPTGATYSFATGTDGATQVGYVNNYNGTTGDHAVLWQGTAASITDLDPGGAYTYSQANAVFGSFQVGFAYKNGIHAFLWQGSAASGIDLTPTGFAQANALGIFGSETVGWAGTPSAKRAGYWNGSAGSFVNLHPLSGFVSSQANATNSGIEVGTGFTTSTSTSAQALLWAGSAGAMINLHPAGYSFSEAFGTNGAKQVGYGVKGGVSHALIWSGSAGSVIDLNSFVAGINGDAQANAIDAAGNIYGWATVGGVQHAMIWSVAAVPLPPAFAIALLGVAATGLHLRRTKIRN